MVGKVGAAGPHQLTSLNTTGSQYANQRVPTFLLSFVESSVAYKSDDYDVSIPGVVPEGGYTINSLFTSLHFAFSEVQFIASESGESQYRH